MGDLQARPITPRSGGPRVSVVVPTHNRPQRLRALLESLREQTLGVEQFEVIVVDDGSVGGGCEAVVRSCSGSLPVTVIRLPVHSGPAAARNAGWRAARAPLVAFTDDDCVASPEWLAAAVEIASMRPGAIVQGPTRPDPRDAGRGGLLSRTVSVETLGPQYETCNIVYPRSVLEALGGFDERFGAAPAAEDTDLAWRAIEQGYATAFAPRALVLHAVDRVGVRGSLHVALRWEAAMRVFASHPQARAAILYRGVFWNVWHYLLWRALLSLLVPAWLRRMLLARYLLQLRARALREGAGVSAVPFLLVHDAVECWAVARGAVRYRTFVL